MSKPSIPCHAISCHPFQAKAREEALKAQVDRIRTTEEEEEDDEANDNMYVVPFAYICIYTVSMDGGGVEFDG